MMKIERSLIRRCVAASGISGKWNDPLSVEGLENAKGAYLLALRLTTAVSFRMGREQAECLAPGWYLYAGSAWGAGGVRARVRRHFRAEKKPHWHIDHLTLTADETSALTVSGGRECDLVAALLSTGGFQVALPGFGSSDCSLCESHLLMPGFAGRS